MKIAIITPFFYPHIGGMERSLFNLAKGLSESEDVFVYTTAFGGNKSKTEFEIVRENSGLLSNWAENICSFLSTSGPFQAVIYGGIGRDVVNGIFNSLREVRKTGGKSFLRIPTSDHIKRHLLNKNMMELLAGFDHFVTIDLLAKDQLETELYFKNTTYIPNGVDTDIYSPDKKFEERRKNILYSGRVAKRKNVHLVLDLIKSISSDYHFIFQGSESFGEKEYYNEIIRNLKNIKNTTIIDPSWDNYQIYKEAGIFILLSEVEGCSNSILEAIASGVYPIVSNIPENKLILKNFGMLIDFNEKSIPEILNDIYNINIAEEDLVDARKFINQHFSISNTVNKWKAILNV